MDVRDMLNPGTPVGGMPTLRLDYLRDAPFTDQVRTAASNVVDAMLNSVRQNVTGLVNNATDTPEQASARYWNEILSSPLVLIGLVVGAILLLRR